MRLTRTQRRIARAIQNGAHVQLVSTAEEPTNDPRGVFVLVHTCAREVDPDGFLYVETVQYRSLFVLHMAGLLNKDAEIVIGFGGD